MREVGQTQYAGGEKHGIDEKFVALQWLNYRHLLYFWTVAKEGSVSAASKKLRLAQPTLSGQIHALEAQTEMKLFRRQGRGLSLTEAGRIAFRCADEIFSLGPEMQTALRGEVTGRRIEFNVGISNALPKLITFHLLAPAFALSERVVVKCQEERADRLLPRLASHELDIVLPDAPANPAISVEVFSHLLGECGVSFFTGKDRAARLRRNFPKSLSGTLFLMPAVGTTLRRSLDAWFDAQRVTPDVVGEFVQGNLPPIQRQAHRAAHEVQERFYAISADRRLRHPAVVAVTEAARNEWFKQS